MKLKKIRPLCPGAGLNTPPLYPFHFYRIVVAQQARIKRYFEVSFSCLYWIPWGVKRHVPSLWVQLLSFSCSFQQNNLANHRLAHPLSEILDLPLVADPGLLVVGVPRMEGLFFGKLLKYCMKLETFGRPSSWSRQTCEFIFSLVSFDSCFSFY